MQENILIKGTTNIILVLHDNALVGTKETKGNTQCGNWQTLKLLTIER